MGKNSFNVLLVGLLFVCGVLTVLMAVVYAQGVREFRRLQADVNRITTQQNIMRSLVTESLEYSKKNSDIDPLLQSVGAKAKSGAGSSNSK